MSIRVRQWLNKGFTALAYLSVLVVSLSLIAILVPILFRGAGAVFFKGTVEFRKMQLDKFNRGDSQAIAAQVAQAAQARQPVYEILDRFRQGLDTKREEEQAGDIHSEFRRQLRNSNLSALQREAASNLSQELRDALRAAYAANETPPAEEKVRFVLAHEQDPTLKGTVAERYFPMAARYRDVLKSLDLSLRPKYQESLVEAQKTLLLLFGPRPGEPLPSGVVDQYGATRMDRAEEYLDRLLWEERWESPGPGQLLQKVRIPRERLFAGTEMARLFPMVRDNLDKMLLPETIAYWSFFTDAGISSHFLGGAGPEIVGTLAITILSILFALPVGVISAAYLVECAGDNVVVNIFRTCINTLAGVPSIVFGLFGLAFFVVWLPQHLGMEPRACILAGSLTLALLVLPIIIRASEEAIRSVPGTYKEASLALGASPLRCFLTVQLPAALPGILTGVILSMSRAAGETAPILFTAAVAFGQFPTSLMAPTPTLSYSSWNMAVTDRAAAMVPHNQFGMVMTLVLLVLVMNVAAIVIRSRVARKLRGH